MLHFTVARIAELLQKHGLGSLQEWRVLEAGYNESIYLINQVVVLHVAAGALAHGSFAKLAAVLQRLSTVEGLASERLVAYEHCDDVNMPGEYLLTVREPGIAALDCWQQIDLPDQQRLSAAMGEALARLHSIDWPAYGGYNPQSAGLGRGADWREYLLDRASEALMQLWSYQGLPMPLLDSIEHALAMADIPRRPRPAFIHGDYGLHNAIVILDEHGWRLNGISGLRSALAGDAEYEFATGLLIEPDEVNPLEAPFLSAYRAVRPLERGWQQRSAVYRLIYHLALCAYIWMEHAGNPVMLQYHRSRLIDALKYVSANG